MDRYPIYSFHGIIIGYPQRILGYAQNTSQHQQIKFISFNTFFPLAICEKVVHETGEPTKPVSTYDNVDLGLPNGNSFHIVSQDFRWWRHNVRANKNKEINLLLQVKLFIFKFVLILRIRVSNQLILLIFIETI